MKNVKSRGQATESELSAALQPNRTIGMGMGPVSLEDARAGHAYSLIDLHVYAIGANAKGEITRDDLKRLLVLFVRIAHGESLTEDENLHLQMMTKVLVGPVVAPPKAKQVAM